MFIQKQNSGVFDGKYIKQLSMRQLMDITESSKQTSGYNQAAEMIALSYFNDEDCTVKMFSDSDAVLEALPPVLFEAASDEVLVFNGMKDNSGGADAENPT